MERAGRAILKSGAGQCVTTEEIAKAGWSAAVGKAVARHTEPRALVRGCLVVDVEDSLWRKQLFPLTRQILKSIENVVGEGIVMDLEFRLAARRKLPGREERQVRDPSEAIADPVLRRLYEASRKRAGAGA